jgi:hypothetical protein
MGYSLNPRRRTYQRRMTDRERDRRRQRMPHNDEITISGVTWRIPRLLKHIADTMSEREANPIPTPPPVTLPPTRFSIQWKTAGNGAWHGFLVAHWDYASNGKTQEYNTCILRIAINSFTGYFESTCILTPKIVSRFFPTYSQCKTFTDDYALTMLKELYHLCKQEESNKVKTNWWE